MANFQVNQGPVNPELLYLAHNHRAYHIFTQQNDVDPSTPLKMRRGDKAFWKHMKEAPLDDGVRELINVAGFGGVLSVGWRRMDNSLINAFVERWRPETHTFHLPCGEATITLQDVQILLGLRIDGDVVIGTDSPQILQYIIGACDSLLGFVPDHADISGGKIRSTVIFDQIRIPLPNNPTVEQRTQRARLIIFHILGTTLFADSASNWIPLIYLTHLVDLRDCGNISWGTAVLGCLYSKLCRATQPNKVEVSGHVLLLQLWAWTRVPTLKPEYEVLSQPEAPYGAWFRTNLRYKNTVHNLLPAIRSQLSMITEEEFIWTPYRDVVTDLPAMCTSGQQYWRCKTPLIIWDAVEFYDPERVMRQFGKQQHIPPPPMFGPSEANTLHSITRQGRASQDWDHFHQRYISQYFNREERNVDGVDAETFRASREYMNWYFERTVVHIINAPRDSSDINTLLISEYDSDSDYSRTKTTY